MRPEPARSFVAGWKATRRHLRHILKPVGEPHPLEDSEQVRVGSVFAAIFFCAGVCAVPAPSIAQSVPPQNSPSPQSERRIPVGTIRRIEFAGLHRISAATLRARISTRVGDPLDPAKIEADVRTLDRLGWFDSVTVEVDELPVLLAYASLSAPDSGNDAAVNSAAAAFFGLTPSLRLVFVIEERPFLAKVEFRGSRLLNHDRIDAILAANGLRAKLAAPVDRTALFKAGRAIEAALAELGHPQARVHVRLREVPTASVRAVFQIEEGPRVEVARVDFAGNRAFADDVLRRQMQRIAPNAPFAGLRDKTTYTSQRLAEDLRHLEDFYRSHGYAEARLGEPQVEVLEDHEMRHWFPWPHTERGLGFRVIIPVEEGTAYRVSEVRLDLAALGSRSASAEVPRALRPQEPYSAENIARARDELAARLAGLADKKSGLRPEVEVQPEFDRGAGLVRITLRARPPVPYVVHRIEFTGDHRFSDRYYRRRVGLKEGDLLDWRKLEAGLGQLARGGFIRPVERRDIDVRFDEAQKIADLSIHLKEIGRQRVSLVGGASGLGSTLGIVYNVFDLLGAEELLTGYLEGGPQSLNLLLGVAKEGVFGTRASLGLNIFHNVVRPYLPGVSGHERLYDSRSTGLGLNTSVPLSPSDALGFNYEASRSSTTVGLGIPLAGLPQTEIRSRSERHAVGTNWTHDTGREHLVADASVSGGRLGGDENVLRGSVEYARLLTDPLTGGRNTWAFRSTFAGVSSFGDAALPFNRRFFAGEQLVRGFRLGELSPYGLASTGQADAADTARVTGANLLAAVNSEYRVPVEAKSHSEAALFFDAGTGWLLPQWLGGSKPQLLNGTNGLLRASTGAELRIPLPVVGQSLRVYYAANPLRLARDFLLPDGSRFRPPDRRTAFGWGLGSFF